MSDCFFELNSEEYTEFIFKESYFAGKQLEKLEDYCVTKINSNWSVISVRTRDVGEAKYENFSYSIFPGIYGLADLGSLTDGGVIGVREQPGLNLKGSGTYVAVIDTGINWRHEAFVNGGNSSKIAVIYDQETDKIYNTEDINRALRDDNYEIPEDSIGHGTFMAGIACGNEKAAISFSGVAPEAGLIIVKLKQAKKYLRDFYSVKDGVPAYSEVDIMRGLQFVLDYCENNRLPVSIVLGIGTTLGAHSGTSPLGKMIANESYRVGNCITIASGNEGNERLHYHGVCMGREAKKVELLVGNRENGFTANIWSKTPYLFSLEIVSPSGQRTARIPVRNASTKLDFYFENTTVYVYFKRFESNSGDNVISLRFKNIAGGIWTINLYSNQEGVSEFDIWIANRSFISENTYFLVSDPDITITDPGNQREAITVAAYDYRDDSIYYRNSRGYNWNKEIKPDFTAPGVDILVPSFSKNLYEIRSGSCIAAGYFGGVAALLLEYGVVRGRIPFLSTSEIKSIIISGCVSKNGSKKPDNIWGYGAIDLYNSLQKLREEL